MPDHKHALEYAEEAIASMNAAGAPKFTIMSGPLDQDTTTAFQTTTPSPSFVLHTVMLEKAPGAYKPGLTGYTTSETDVDLKLMAYDFMIGFQPIFLSHTEGSAFSTKAVPGLPRALEDSTDENSNDLTGPADETTLPTVDSLNIEQCHKDMLRAWSHDVINTIKAHAGIQPAEGPDDIDGSKTWVWSTKTDDGKAYSLRIKFTENKLKFKPRNGSKPIWMRLHETELPPTCAQATAVPHPSEVDESTQNSCSSPATLVESPNGSEGDATDDESYVYV